MRLRRFCHMMAFGSLVSGAILQSAVRADTLPAAYIGFTGSSAGTHADDVATYTIGTTTTNIASHEGTGAGSAYAARDAFLSAVNQNYFYEDFQELDGKTYTTGTGRSARSHSYDSATFAQIAGASSAQIPLDSSGAFPLSFKQVGSPAGPTPTGGITSDKPANVQLLNGPISARGDFGAYGANVVSAVPGTSPDPDGNWYLDVQKNTSVILSFGPGQTAVGLELNDLLQPSNDTVTINFSNGTSEIFQPTLGALKSNGRPGGILSTNNTWFVGVVGDTPISTIQINDTGDPFTIDNIYLATPGSPSGLTQTPTSVPLPSAAWGGLGLMASLMALRKRSARAVA